MTKRLKNSTYDTKLLSREGGIYYKRGFASLCLSIFYAASKRGETPLLNYIPLSWKERGIKGMRLISIPYWTSVAGWFVFHNVIDLALQRHWRRRVGELLALSESGKVRADVANSLKIPPELPTESPDSIGTSRLGRSHQPLSVMRA